MKTAPVDMLVEPRAREATGTQEGECRFDRTLARQRRQAHIENGKNLHFCDSREPTT